MNQTNHNSISLVEISIRTLVLLAILFGASGTLAWPSAWIAVVSFVAFCLILWGWLNRNNRELLVDRLNEEKNLDRPRYDRIFSRIYKSCFLAWLVTLGLDRRFHWTDSSLWMNVTGGVLLLLALILIFWVFVTNSFLAREVRIQHERSHSVAKTGPYRIVRHPMYSGIGLMFAGASLLMGSLAGLAVAILLFGMLCIRSVFEESTLSESLEGYAQYQQEVTYRVIPLIW